MLSLSTVYHSPEGKSGKELVERTRALGFEALEINVEVEKQQIDEIEKAVSKGEIKVSSVHNFSPRLMEIPEGQSLYSGGLFSSNKPDERKLAVKLTNQTIDTAVRLGATAIVIHAGEVEMEPPSGREFFKYVTTFGKASLFAKYKQEIIEAKKKMRGRFVENVIETLSGINEYAVKKGVRLGLENRFYYNEIPDIDEVGMIMDRLGENIYYWHDVGHAEIFSRMELLKQGTDFLDRYSNKLLGIHLHDVKGMQDHLAPGTGEVDFSAFKKYLTPATVRVLEIHSRAAEKDVKSAPVCLSAQGIK